jgi:hypothetical protein
MAYQPDGIRLDDLEGRQQYTEVNRLGHSVFDTQGAHL